MNLRLLFIAMMSTLSLAATASETADRIPNEFIDYPAFANQLIYWFTFEGDRICRLETWHIRT